METPRWEESGVSGFFIQCFEGRQTEGCCLGCVEERGRERGSAAAGAWRKKKANLNIGRGKKQRREIRIEEKIFQFE